MTELVTLLFILVCIGSVIMAGATMFINGLYNDKEEHADRDSFLELKAWMKRDQKREFEEYQFTKQ